MPAFTVPSRIAITGMLALIALSLAACPSADMRGTYDVELRVQRIGVPIEGTLVLGAPRLDLGPGDATWIVPGARGDGTGGDGDPLRGDGTGGDGDPLRGDGTGGNDGDPLLEPNSCLVIPHANTGEPLFVMLFETRISAGTAQVPFAVFDTGSERIEVVDLRLFANALGGEIVYRDDQGSGEGRLYGDRARDADGGFCVEAIGRQREAQAAAAI